LVLRHQAFVLELTSNQVDHVHGTHQVGMVRVGGLGGLTDSIDEITVDGEALERVSEHEVKAGCSWRVLSRALLHWGTIERSI
jgi:hypothetical protein